jgi:hypothetical protein
MRKCAIVVFVRSYGMLVEIENRGPQLVQLMNAYRNRRSAGFRSSDRQSGHVARSGELTALLLPVRLRLETILNELRTSPSRSCVTSQLVMIAAGGRLECNALTNVHNVLMFGTSISISTPSSVFATAPPRQNRSASRFANGRKPTP